MGERYGKFRGRGTISIDEESITVEGKHVFSSAIIRGLWVFILAIIPTILFNLRVLFFFPLLLISYYLVQYAILRHWKIVVKWGQITRYEIDPGHNMIAFLIEKNPSGPIIFETSDFEQIGAAFREKLPERERTSRGLAAVEERYDEQINSMARIVDKFLNKR